MIIRRIDLTKGDLVNRQTGDRVQTLKGLFYVFLRKKSRRIIHNFIIPNEQHRAS
jgi:hypothetical protein